MNINFISNTKSKANTIKLEHTAKSVESLWSKRNTYSYPVSYVLSNSFTFSFYLFQYQFDHAFLAQIFKYYESA